MSGSYVILATIVTVYSPQQYFIDIQAGYAVEYSY